MMTTESFAEKFNKADTVVHAVEAQWHHPILTKYGFVPLTKEQTGFVRAYTYENPAGRKIRCNTGVNADYWTDLTTGKGGYWSDLEPHLKTL